MKNTEMIAWWLVIIGGLNWGLVGLGNMLGGADWNLVSMVLGGIGMMALSDIIYILVGLSALWLLWAKMGK